MKLSATQQRIINGMASGSRLNYHRPLRAAPYYRFQNRRCTVTAELLKDRGLIEWDRHGDHTAFREEFCLTELGKKLAHERSHTASKIRRISGGTDSRG
jgi:hypothetical protein